MLYHHDNTRTYNEAASDAARHARTIMEQKIEAGRASALALIERVNTTVPADAIVRTRALNFVDAGNGVQVEVSSDPRAIHRHALGQMAAKAGIPGAYLAELAAGQEPWQRALAAHVLNQHFGSGQPADKYLVRSVNGEVRGFLSDRYRRLDSRPLIEAFAEACGAVGAVPVDGVVSDTRLALKAFLPMVFEPVPNEVMCLGIEWGNSDFGAARHTVRAMIWRLWCTNKATMEDSLAQVHLGRQLGDDIQFSQRTYDLDTRASVSALRDVVRGVLGPAKVNTLLDTIKTANEKKIEWKNVKTALARRLLKGEMTQVEAAYESEDVVNLPAGKSAWRASNAISWIAGKTADADRRLELERVAGELVNGRRDAEAKEAA
jgi:hypothetical protein